jgi:hypothetical protein
MKNIFNLLLLLNIFYLLKNSVSTNLSGHCRIRNLALRMIVFKEKKLSKILLRLKNLSNIYYNKAIVSTAEGIIKYNDLPDDDKTIIEAIISFCY